MKYYVYLSDNKIDMLYSQIKDSDTQRETKIGADLKLIKGEYTKRKTQDTNKYKKAEEIVKALEKQRLIGSIEEPIEYVKAELQMGWQINIKENFTYWSALEKEGETLYIIGLVGSCHNIVGNEPSDKLVSASNTFTFMEICKNTDMDEYAEKEFFFMGEGRRVEPFFHQETDMELYEHMNYINKRYKGEKANYEFIAKVLYNKTYSVNEIKESAFKYIDFDIEGIKKYVYLLATPLYVSLAD